MTNIEKHAKKQEELKDLYNKLEEQKNMIYANLKANETAIEIYRVESVKRVIKFIAYNYKHLKKETISNLCVHCLNKLEGNIDGIEVTLKYDEE